MKYKRKVIDVERRLGFLYVPAVAQEFMPSKKSQVNVLLEGGNETKSLSYNSKDKRIYGLTKWYKNHGIHAGNVLNIEIENSLLKVNIEQRDKKVTNHDQVSDEFIDLSGLSSTSKGNIVEDRIKELIILYGQGLLNVYRPVVDNRGIDIIVMRNGVFTPIFLQVKSRFNASKKKQLLFDVNDKTFNPHHSFYIVGVSFNPSTLEIDENILFIPSTDFNDAATSIKSSNKKRVIVSLKSNSMGKWTEFLIPKSDLVNKLLEKFAEISTYIK